MNGRHAFNEGHPADLKQQAQTSLGFDENQGITHNSIFCLKQ